MKNAIRDYVCNVQLPLIKKFFFGTMKGTKEAYLDSFAMQPYQLSDSLFMVTADYSTKLFAAENYEKLKEFSSAILESGRIESIMQHYFIPNAVLLHLPVWIRCQKDTKKLIATIFSR